MTLDYRLTRTLRGLSYPPSLWNPVWIGPLEPSDLQACFDDAASIERVYEDAIELWDGCVQPGLVERTLQFFVKLYLQDDILAKVDRAGMMNSLEVRSPFLDLDLVNFVRRLPTRFKLRRGRTKYLLREAMRPFLPSWIIDRPKHGFAVPMAQWLREDWLGTFAPLPRGIRAEFVRRKVMAHQRRQRKQRRVSLEPLAADAHCPCAPPPLTGDWRDVPADRSLSCCCCRCTPSRR